MPFAASAANYHSRSDGRPRLPGIGIGICVYLGYNWAMRWTDTATAGILANLTPITSLILAWLLLNEQLMHGQLISMAIALAGIFLATAAFSGNR